MVFVIHPLTQQSGEPKYTASDFRLTVSNFLTAGTDEAFGSVQGIRSDSLDAHVSMTDSTITVYPHSGIIAPWTGVGAYAYAITSDITVPRPTTGDYYVVLTVDDPSQSHGSEPQGRVDLIPASTSRASIDGLVIARTQGSAINDIANRLRNGTVIETVSKAELDLIKPTPRTKGFVRFGDGMGEYEFNGSSWTLKSSDWVNIGYGDGYKAAPFGNAPRIRISGGLVFLQGVSQSKSGSVLTGDHPFGVIPAPYRSKTIAYATVNGAGERSMNIQVEADGIITVKWSNGGGYVAGDGLWWSID